MGLTKDESSRYQQLAAMPADHFETAVATAKATAGEVTTAFMLREAKRMPAKKMTMADQRRLQDLKAAKDRGTSMLSTYARLLLQALRAQSEFTQQERELLAELAGAIHSQGLST
jgi:ADP-dependent phosphofructokinase/glucokinase